MLLPSRKYRLCIKDLPKLYLAFAKECLAKEEANASHKDYPLKPLQSQLSISSNGTSTAAASAPVSATAAGNGSNSNDAKKKNKNKKK
jgi:hypothetical protein